MRNIIWILMLLISCTTIQGQNSYASVEFKYIGDSDKPIPSLKIVAIKEVVKDNPCTKIVVVSKATISFIGNFISTHNKIVSNKDDTNKGLDVAFKINVNGNRYGFVKRREAVSYFNELKIEMEENEDLDNKDVEAVNQYFSEVLPRIDW